MEIYTKRTKKLLFLLCDDTIPVTKHIGYLFFAKRIRAVSTGLLRNY